VAAAAYGGHYHASAGGWQCWLRLAQSGNANLESVSYHLRHRCVMAKYRIIGHRWRQASNSGGWQRRINWRQYRRMAKACGGSNVGEGVAQLKHPGWRKAYGWRLNTVSKAVSAKP